MQSRIVGALLAGPSPYLASPVTVTAFPPGAQPNETPSLDDGTVTVDLSSNVLDAGPTQQSRMLEQLTWSLRSPTVTAVKMTANSVEVPTSEPATAEANPAAYYEAVGSDGKLFGDVDFASASAVAGAITPVPGGVGPMTIAMLLDNTLRAASARENS